MHREDKRGQSLVEFAMVLPIFLMLLVGTFDLGHVVWSNDMLSNAAREGARYAIVHGAGSSCPAGPGSVSGPLAASCENPSPSKQDIYDAATHWTDIGGGTVTVTACYWNTTQCNGDADEAGATNVRGTRVTVTVTATVSLSAPSLLGLGPISLSSSSTMLVNH